MNLLPNSQKTRFSVKQCELLKFVPDCYKNQRMCNKAVDTYVHALQFVPNCYKTQKMCNKAIDTCGSAMQLVPD